MQHLFARTATCTRRSRVRLVSLSTDFLRDPQALHALALSSPHLCTSGRTPSAFLLRLAPYLKISDPDKGCTEEQQRQAVRNEAERLVCLLPLLSTLLASLRGGIASTAPEIERDLLRVITRNPFPVVRFLQDLSGHHLIACMQLSHLDFPAFHRHFNDKYDPLCGSSC